MQIGTRSQGSGAPSPATPRVPRPRPILLGALQRDPGAVRQAHARQVPARGNLGGDGIGEQFEQGLDVTGCDRVGGLAQGGAKARRQPGRSHRRAANRLWGAVRL